MAQSPKKSRSPALFSPVSEQFRVTPLHSGEGGSSSPSAPPPSTARTTEAPLQPPPELIQPLPQHRTEPPFSGVVEKKDLVRTPSGSLTMQVHQPDKETKIQTRLEGGPTPKLSKGQALRVMPSPRVQALARSTVKMVEDLLPQWKPTDLARAAAPFLEALGIFTTVEAFGSADKFGMALRDQLFIEEPSGLILRYRYCVVLWEVCTLNDGNIDPVVAFGCVCRAAALDLMVNSSPAPADL